MSGFGHFARTALELEREIFKRGLLIGLDWQDPATMRALAHEALTCTTDCRLGLLRNHDAKARGRGELFALSEMMLDTMRQSAQVGVHTQGGPAWKAFGRALYEESARLGAGSSN
ncbi:MAG: hypothetical protein CVU19_04540 [Betaproteobacteria bacterium HGW-Betaproteobacteria-13]|jgi:hypothetical protein|uniref:Uncharacterized protein n=1 Tax=Parazoarcus communis TaxID=41977 RepID=A0A2U8GYX3_9RHOO|nr:hypothetical protein [Parazoarcus communis]AWI78530.1 hypothetical protein CEW87_03645 [Parazoarcus communis]PKO81910.1 MAG: hypothetical protein CVU19_04540 [Betaproteobacteria bacterium HGW-Betaproteobacteria-13]